MAEQDTFDAETDVQIALEDVGNVNEEDGSLRTVVNFVMERYNKAEDTRRQDEERWLQAYRNYRGIYGPDVQFTDSEKSRVFIKVTKTKVLAAYGQIVDVLFANNTFPISVEPTQLPEGVSESVHYDPEQTKLDELMGGTTGPYGFAGDGEDLPPGTTLTSIMQKGLGALKSKLQDIPGIKQGPGLTPSSVTFFPAMVAAKKMEKKIKDQLEEANASKQLRSTSFEMALFGTGVMKGPFAVDKEYPSWDEEGTYSPTLKTVPVTSHVSVWNFYPDPDAANMDDAQYVIERHKMSRTQLRSLKKRPFFRSQVIDDVIAIGEGYSKKYWEDDLRDYITEHDIERFEVLEYWGNIDRSMLEEAGVDIPDDLGDFDEVQANIWYVNNRIIRAVINPFKPSRIPYYAVPYELNPYSFFGVGIAENI